MTTATYLALCITVFVFKTKTVCFSYNMVIDLVWFTDSYFSSVSSDFLANLCVSVRITELITYVGMWAKHLIS